MIRSASDDSLGEAGGEGDDGHDGYDAEALDDAALALELGVRVKAQPVTQVSDSQCPPDSFSETQVVGENQAECQLPQPDNTELPTLPYIPETQLDPETLESEALTDTQLEPDTPPEPDAPLEPVPTQCDQPEVSAEDGKEADQSLEVAKDVEKAGELMEKLSLEDVQARIQEIRWLDLLQVFVRNKFWFPISSSYYGVKFNVILSKGFIDFASIPAS